MQCEQQKCKLGRNLQWEMTKLADVVSHASVDPNKNIISSKTEEAQGLAGQVGEV